MTSQRRYSGDDESTIDVPAMADAIDNDLLLAIMDFIRIL